MLRNLRLVLVKTVWCEWFIIGECYVQMLLGLLHVSRSFYGMNLETSRPSILVVFSLKEPLSGSHYMTASQNLLEVRLSSNLETLSTEIQGIIRKRVSFRILKSNLCWYSFSLILKLFWSKWKVFRWIHFLRKISQR